MDKVSEANKEFGSATKGFIDYILNFDDDTKCELMNMIQYSLLSLVPIVVILKGIKHFIPEEDDSKGTLEITAESVGQIILIIIGIWFTNRLIRYVPTYSGSEYTNFNPICFLIPLILILTTMQTKLGMKINILAERVIEMLTGNTEYTPPIKKQGGNIKVTQPLAGQHQPSQADYIDNSQLLPSNHQLTAMPQVSSTQSMQNSNHNSNNMYQKFGDMNQQMTTEPIAANELSNGMFGGTPWQ